MTNWLKIDNATQAIDTSDIVITAGYNAKIEKMKRKYLIIINLLLIMILINFRCNIWWKIKTSKISSKWS